MQKLSPSTHHAKDNTYGSVISNTTMSFTFFLYENAFGYCVLYNATMMGVILMCFQLAVAASFSFLVPAEA